MIVTSATIDTERFAAPLRRRRRRRAGRRGDRAHVPGRGPLPADRRRARRRPRPGPGRRATPSTSWRAQRPGRRARVPQRRAGDPRRRRRAAPPRRPRGTEVLPLYARLSSAEQHRIFQPHAGRRIVLSTNVAETSITVPGRPLRRRHRRRPHLPLQPPAEGAAAADRADLAGLGRPAGRALRPRGPGRLHPALRRGRLRRPPGVHRAGDPADEPGVGHPADDRARPRRRGRVPVPRAARPGGDPRRLRCCSRSSARIDDGRRRPRPAADAASAGSWPGCPSTLGSGGWSSRPATTGCVREVLVIAAGTVDPGPARATRRASARRPTQPTAGSTCGGSDLLSIVAAVGPPARAAARSSRATSSGELCRDRVPQLPARAGVAGPVQPAPPGRRRRRPARRAPTRRDPDDVHRAVLAGLLSHVGVRDRDGRQFRGARGRVVRRSPAARCWRAPAAVGDGGRAGRDRPPAGPSGGRDQPGVGRAARPGTSSSARYGEPRWDAERGAGGDHGDGHAVRAADRHRADRAATTASTPPSPGPCSSATRSSTASGHARTPSSTQPRVPATGAGRVEAKARRGGCSTTTRVEDFYDRRVGRRTSRRAGASTAGGGRPTARARHSSTSRTSSSAAGLVRSDDHPDAWRQGDVALPLTYRFAPGQPLDGVTVHVPLAAAQPGHDRRVRLAGAGLPARAGRRPRAHAAEGRPPAR